MKYSRTKTPPSLICLWILSIALVLLGVGNMNTLSAAGVGLAMTTAGLIGVLMAMALGALRQTLWNRDDERDQRAADAMAADDEDDVEI
ncbi:hypothetical protein ICW40_01130 [Actinotalea ferrariae]|uniref:hypothetical protein n=1 Tax=Actinotalea ferrariae TaxID=1386098 RepID=UPI001C8C70F4|nr:hypothetical protein [Actinotalea ferrariae]MBX9243408.1 hypothetical protein [Actinotalea ferrariae]